ncbi:PAS domain S-box protein [Vitreimonas sp.]|uniref:hybrid sensor histidine kinase/response regulator n=1 Tax=Vitreimonas sp. TaxID=3069702 RepID=UPI002EDA73AF
MPGANEQSRLRAVVDTAVDGVILIDARGVILMFNPACERLFGYASFEVIGRNVKMLMPEPYQAGHDDYLRNYRETGERKIIGIGREVWGLKRHGATFPMDLSVGESEENGEPIYVGVIRDLTERKASEQALREGAERLRAVVETAVDGVILIDSGGTVLMFNPACERLFGYRAHEVIGQNVRMLMPGPYREQHDSYIGNYVRTRAPKIIGIGREVEGRRKDGSTFPMELSVGEAEQDDRSIFVGIVHDLTVRKRTEEQLVQAQKMETVGQLSGGIAHDFNNLLTVILGNAEALSARLKARADLRNVADTIVAAAERGAELTQRLLAFSRRQMLQPTAVNCTALVESMRVLLKRTLRENIDLRIASTPSPIFAMADPAQLENALLNLSINAQDAMPSGGVLTLSVEQIDLDQTALARSSDVRPGRYVSVCVTDDGEGMSKETLERAFEPFFTTKEVGKGSGLGLSMVYGFVKQSNGHVAIYSEQGLGTSVRLYLPAAEADSEQPPALRNDDFGANEGGDETILVVEDDPFVRSHVISSLEQLGYRTIVASDGREALNLLHGGARPDLLFTDIVMPGGISGWELAAQARAKVPGLRVLFTSGYPQETLTRRGQVDQYAMLLSKPYRLAELARRVRETLDSLV